MKNLRPNKYTRILTALITILSIVMVIYAQQNKTSQDKKEMLCPMMDKMAAERSKSHEDCPMMKKQNQKSSVVADDTSKHANHQALGMENREKAMGFSQTATTHHFLLMKNGGTIQVEADNSADTENRDAIRSHLTAIAKQFSGGIFTVPFAVHGQVPPEVAVLKELKQDIKYNYRETKNGAQVIISTKNPKALAAIHGFLKFQIEEHQTGDPTNLEN